MRANRQHGHDNDPHARDTRLKILVHADSIIAPDHDMFPCHDTAPPFVSGRRFFNLVLPSWKKAIVRRCWAPHVDATLIILSDNPFREGAISLLAK